MKDITIVIGSKENISEDINILARQFSDTPETLIVAGEDIKNAVISKASSLFIEENLVLFIIDPEKKVIDEIKGPLQTLKEKVSVVIYFTSDIPTSYPEIADKKIVMEKEKEKRIRNRVLTILKQYDKRMTDKGFELLMEKIKDETILEMELMKLINYVGDRKKIDSRDVNAIVVETHQDNMIGFFEAFSRKDKKQMLYILDNLINNMNAPMDRAILSIHSFLVKQTRLLLQSKDIEEVFNADPKYSIFLKSFSRWKEAVEIKTNDKRQYLHFQKPFYAYNLVKTGKQFTIRDLISFLNALAVIDTDIKTGLEHEHRVRLEYGLLEV